MISPSGGSSVHGAGLTHRGRVRKHNEDAFLAGGVQTAETMERAVPFAHDAVAGWILAVADGIGGNRAGERASRETLELLATPRYYTPDAVVAVIQSAHQRMFQISATTPDQTGLGTTLAGVACGSEGVFAFAVGDSRVYLQQDDFLTQITRDDNVEAMLVDAGETAPEGSNRRLLRALTQCIGGRFPERKITPHIIPLTSRRKLRLLICTDGLTDMLDHDSLEKCMPPDHPACETTENLLTEALSRGARDNLSLIVADLKAAS